MNSSLCLVSAAWFILPLETWDLKLETPHRIYKIEQ